jgi:2',3'-cyclic-nucleotide 2'-phosphodiesterase/3'-nucleotidase
MALGKVEFSLEKRDGVWKILGKSAKVIPVTKEVPADSEIADLAKPYHELTERYLNLPVAESPAELDGRLGRVQDTALLDAVQQVQLHSSKADVSMTALFNQRVHVAKGPVTVRQIAALYIYDNELYVIEANGKILREALENAARYFLTCRDATCSGPLINSNVIGFNFDIAQGVEYEIDLTRPEGQRIRNLRYHGKPLEDAQPLRLAVNNYRAGGSAGYAMFKSAPVVWKSGEEIREMIIAYYIDHKRLPAAPDNNWRVVPEAAARELEKEARAEAARYSTQ